MYSQMLQEKTIEDQLETERKQKNMEQEQHVMLLILEKVLIRIGDRARVQTDREAAVMTTKTDIVGVIKEMTKTEGAQTGATKVQTDSRDRRLGTVPDSLDQNPETETKNKVDRALIDKEVQVETDSTIITEMIEMIRTETIVQTDIRAEITTVDRVDRQKGENPIATAETIAETVATTETEVLIEAKRDTVAETKTEAEMIAEIGNPVLRDSDLTRETDFRKKHRDRKIGMTRIGTEETTVQGHTIRTKRRIVGNV